ncbi:hypothetical protein J6590_049657 [Homalodisca vitripennis]|nr:hypothetical protein J6590_049657 [Homalodisca vitripennis]
MSHVPDAGWTSAQERLFNNNEGRHKPDMVHKTGDDLCITDTQLLVLAASGCRPEALQSRLLMTDCKLMRGV